jgi:hypothetical protein
MSVKLRSALFAATVSLSAPAGATNLIGDVIFGTYDVPCDSCDAIEQYEYSVNPFTVDAASVETDLSINFDFDTEVDFGASSLVLTAVQDVTYLPYAFNGPEFFVLTGNPFGTVISVTPPAGEPVDAYVSGGVLFVNWQGDSFKAGDTITIAFGAPEAPAWTMMALGFACLGAVAFRRRAGAPNALFQPSPSPA